LLKAEFPNPKRALRTGLRLRTAGAAPPRAASVRFAAVTTVVGTELFVFSVRQVCRILSAKPNGKVNL